MSFYYNVYGSTVLLHPRIVGIFHDMPDYVNDLVIGVTAKSKASTQCRYNVSMIADLS